MNTLVNARAPARAYAAGASRLSLAAAIRFLADAPEALRRSEATRKALRRRRYAALLAHNPAAGSRRS